MTFILTILLLVVATVGFAAMLTYNDTKYLYTIFTVTLAVASILLYLIVRSVKG